MITRTQRRGRKGGGNGHGNGRGMERKVGKRIRGGGRILERTLRVLRAGLYSIYSTTSSALPPTSFSAVPPIQVLPPRPLHHHSPHLPLIQTRRRKKKKLPLLNEVCCAAWLGVMILVEVVRRIERGVKVSIRVFSEGFAGRITGVRIARRDLRISE